MEYKNLEILDMNSYYGESHILHDISLQVTSGIVVAILGRNGMGKTTLINSIIGLVKRRKGMIWFRGKDISNLPSHRIAKMGMALVPQGRRVFHSLSVQENLTFSARGSERKNQWTLDEVYFHFPILKDRKNQRAGLLSGGQQQMLSIGRALLTNPSLLLMDEPCEGLAPLLVREIASIMMKLKGCELSIMLVEQNIPLTLAVADYTYILSRGRILFQSTAEQLRDNNEILDKYIGVSVG